MCLLGYLYFGLLCVHRCGQNKLFLFPGHITKTIGWIWTILNTLHLQTLSRCLLGSVNFDLLFSNFCGEPGIAIFSQNSEVAWFYPYCLQVVSIGPIYGFWGNCTLAYFLFDTVNETDTFCFWAISLKLLGGFEPYWTHLISRPFQDVWLGSLNFGLLFVTFVKKWTL